MVEEGKKEVVINEETPLLAEVKGETYQNANLYSRCAQGMANGNRERERESDNEKGKIEQPYFFCSSL